MKKTNILWVVIFVLYVINIIFLNYVILDNIKNFSKLPAFLNNQSLDTIINVYKLYIKIRPFVCIAETLLYIIGILFVNCLLYIGTILFLDQKISFSKLTKSCLLSEFVCIVHLSVNNICSYFGIFHDGIQSIGSPLLFMQAQKLDIWLITVFNSMNIFWIAYVVVLILSVKYTCKITYKESTNIVLCSYGFVSLLMIVFTCLFMMLQ